MRYNAFCCTRKVGKIYHHQHLLFWWWENATASAGRRGWHAKIETVDWGPFPDDIYLPARGYWRLLHKIFIRQ